MAGRLTRSELETRLRGEHVSAFNDYWWRLREGSGDSVPGRKALDPSQIKAALPYVLLHDLGTPGKSLLRLVGTEIVNRYGFDPTGRNYVDLVSKDRRDTAYSELNRTARHPCGMRVVVEARYVSGKRTVAEALGYPLTSRTGDPMMFFVDQLIERPAHDLNQQTETMELFRVRERDYVDVGFGTPGPDHEA